MISPLLITDVLKLAGANKSLVILATAGIALYHFRSLLGIGRRVGSWMKVLAAIGIVVVLGVAGVVPGYEAMIDPAKLGQFAHEVWSALITAWAEVTS